MKRILLLFFWLSAFAFSGRAQQGSLTIDPLDWPFGGLAGLSQVTFTTRPLGVYMECNMYLWYNQGDYGGDETDSLELTHIFYLPEEAIVTESWLWLDDNIIAAEIIEATEGVTIFDNIVGEKKDPSILTKNTATEYEMHVFPVIPGQDRRVKITYLMPMEWHSNSASVTIPTNVINSGATPLDEVKVTMYVDDEWTDPLINEDYSAQTIPGTDAELGDFENLFLSGDDIGQPLHISYTPPSDSVFLRRYPFTNHVNSHDFFQLAVVPERVFGAFQSKSIAVVLDYEEGNSEETFGDLLFAVEETLIRDLEDDDHFQIILQNSGQLQTLSDWMPCDEASIRTAFDGLQVYSQVEPCSEEGLLEAGDLLSSRLDYQAVLLYSNADVIDTQHEANQLIVDYQNLYNFPVYCGVFQTSFSTSFWANSKLYKGSTYLFETLSNVTYGAYYDRIDNNLSHYRVVRETLQEIDEYIDYSVEIRANGFKGFRDYSVKNYLLTGNKAYMSVGMLLSNSTDAEISLLIPDLEILEGVSFDIPRNVIEPQDSLIRKMWAGKNIQDLETKEGNANTIEILQVSIENQVLSTETAFLALEPVDTINAYCVCRDESTVNILEGQESSKAFLVQVHPNPFNDFIQLSLALPDGLSNSAGEIALLDITGMELFRTEFISEEGPLGIDWPDFLSDLPEGNYVVRVRVADHFQSVLIHKQ